MIRKLSARYFMTYAIRSIKKKEITGRIPHNLIASLVASHKTVCPWVTRDSINNEMRRRRKIGIFILRDKALIKTQLVWMTLHLPPSQYTKHCIKIKRWTTCWNNSEEKETRWVSSIIRQKNEITEIFVKEKRLSIKDDYLPVSFLPLFLRWRSAIASLMIL